MSGWSAGYTSDIEYLSSFYPEQTPRRLSLACLLCGHEPPALEARYRYCELGCGQGLTLNVLAAADSGGHFVGVDFNPAHIARARALAAAAGLENVEFHEASFEELAEPGNRLLSTPFDVVALHGVYSWISAENRRALVELLRRHVNPGGLVYAGYNAMPGWAPALPLQRLLVDSADLNSGRSDRQIETAIGLAGDLVRAGALYNHLNPFLDDMREHVENGHIRYLVHEYLNRHWEPRYFADVAREFGEAKLTFVGSASLFENFDHLHLTPEQREFLATVPAPLRETIKDHCVNRRFRRDVFVRGAQTLSDQQRTQRLRAIRLVLVIPRSAVDLKLKLPVGEGALSPDTYNPVFDALAEEPRSIGELLDLPELRQAKSSIDAVELAGVLVGTRQAEPVRDATTSDMARARRFNNALSEHIIRGGTYRGPALASAMIGTAISQAPFQIIVCAEVAADPDATAESVADGVLARLNAVGEVLLREGKSVGDDGGLKNTLIAELRTFLADRIPLWKSLGIL